MEEKVFHITKQKLRELKKEHDDLVVKEHVKIMGHDAPKFLESEDMNPEFVSFQEDMGSLRARIDGLKEILEHHKIIKNPPKEKRGLVDIGATVMLAADGKKSEFMIVGTLEANPLSGKISNESPVGKALLGKKVGDEVIIPTPEKIKYKIKNIHYEAG